MKLIGLIGGGFVFEEPHRQAPLKKRLTITCHGGRNFVKINGQKMDPLRLALFIRYSTNLTSLRTVRLIACHSAESSVNLAPGLCAPLSEVTSESFGSKLSLYLPNITVKAYLGTVSSFGLDFRLTDSILSKKTNISNTEIEDFLTRNFKIIKDGTMPYHGVTFLNGIAIRQSFPKRIENNTLPLYLQ